MSSESNFVPLKSLAHVITKGTTPTKEQGYADDGINFIRALSIDKNGQLDEQHNPNGSVQNIPNKYALHQNYPNPFNPITKINYNLPNTVKVKVDIYDIRGRKVKSLLNQLQDPGFKSIQWDALNDLGERVSSGMYFYRIETSEFKQTKKMILLK